MRPLAALFLLLASSLPLFAQEKNHFTNPGIDGSATGWQAPGAEGTRFDFDPDVGATSAGSLHAINLTGAEDAPYNWRQTCDVRDAKTRRFRLGAKVKITALKPGAQVALVAQCWDESRSQIHFVACGILKNEGDWRAVESVFDAPAATRYVFAMAYLRGHGEVWWDDFVLEETTAPTTAPGAGGTDAESEALARGLAGDVPWELTAAAAFEKATAEKKPILLYVRCTDHVAGLVSARESIRAELIPFADDGLRKDLLFRAGPLTDRDVADLVSRRFIPACATYVLSSEGRGHVAAGEVDSLSPWGLKAVDVVTPALVVLDKGEVTHRLHRIGALSTDLVDRWLRRALDDLNEKSSAKTAEEAYRDGDLARARKLLSGERGAEARALLADIHVREGAWKAAEKELRGLKTPAAHRARARISMRKGEWERAVPELEPLLEDQALHDEASYWLGACLQRSGRLDEALAIWRASQSESPYGRKCALASLAGGPRPWLAETLRAWPESEKDVEHTETAAPDAFDADLSILALIELQRHDGSFTGHSGEIGYWDAALTAIAVDALQAWEKKLDHDMKAKVQASKKAAIAWLEEWTKQAPHRLDPFNAPYATATLVAQGRKAAAARAVTRMEAGQLEDGNWSIYGAERPASFNTAQCVIALATARDAGINVSEKGFDRAVLALRAMLQQGDLFPYSTASGHEWMTTPHGAIARDPLCENALMIGGKGDPKRLERALERFLEHQAELRLPTKKLYDYFNGRGHGGYFFLYAHRNAIEAARSAPSKLRREVITTAREAVLAAREGDGTFLDSYMIGRAYATAMALCILAEPVGR